MKDKKDKFEEMKIALVMKARGVSRAMAIRILKANDRKRKGGKHSGEGSGRKMPSCCPPIQRMGFTDDFITDDDLVSAEDFFGD